MASTAGDQVDAFFTRCSLPLSTRARCWDFVRARYHSADVEQVACQGYCSFTLAVGEETIVQFRPPVHKLDVRLTDAARGIYGHVAPRAQSLGVLKGLGPPLDSGHYNQQMLDEAVAIDDEDEHDSLHVYSMTRVPGISLAELRSSNAVSCLTTAQLQGQRESMVEQFASFIAAGWKAGRPASDAVVSSLRGRVGGSMEWRLRMMLRDIPVRFRAIVQTTLNSLDRIESLPWVLTHGDVNAANVMVHGPQASGDVALSGFLDWAEAEYLPFGVGLYGLEELLGERDGGEGSFVYYPEAEPLGQVFWAKLEREISGGTQLDSSFMDIVKAAHVLGLLLWHGIAFDDGKLNRVVQDGEDDDEMRRLDLFAAQRLVQSKDGGVAAPASRKARLFDIGEAFVGHLHFPNTLVGRS